MNKLDRLLTLFIWSILGVFFGRALYEYFYYRNHPEFYAMTSAPWYTNLLVNGLVYGAVLIIVFTIRLILRRVSRRKDD